MKINIEGWQKALIIASQKMEVVAQLSIIETDTNNFFEAVSSMFSTNQSCALCRHVGINEIDLPDCSKCILTCFGQHMEFSCITPLKTKGLTLMQRIIRGIAYRNLTKEELGNLARTAAARLRSAAKVSELLNAEDMIT